MVVQSVFFWAVLSRKRYSRQSWRIEN